MRRKESKDREWSRKAESWHRREVDLVHGFPIVSEVFFFFGKMMSDQCVEDHAVHIVCWQGK